ncbi:MAG: hypothetical protein NZT92_01885 [Abditibacteriales bacterium]|nr:hypothetical protein [Abditibacteriales bacterium]MDW8364634.1 hypothetical protein [Abditibacteriales bacterium]
MVLTYVDMSSPQPVSVKVCVPDNMVYAWVKARRKKRKLQSAWCRLASMGVPDELLIGIEEDLVALTEQVKTYRDEFWRCVDAQLPEAMRGGAGMIEEWWMPRAPGE